MGRIILSRKLPDGACVPAILIRVLAAFGFSAGFDPAGKEARAVFCIVGFVFEAVRSRVTEAAEDEAPSNLAAEAAVGAVAAAGRRTGRVGDFGLGFANAGDVGPGFLTVFAVEAVEIWAGLGAILPDSFAGADGLLAGFSTSFVSSFFGSCVASGLVAAVFAGGAAFDCCCFPDVVALIEVCGADGAEISRLVSAGSRAVEGTIEAAGSVSIGAGVALGFSSVVDSAAWIAFPFPFVTPPVEALFCGPCGCVEADFNGWAPFGLLVTGPALGALF